MFGKEIIQFRSHDGSITTLQGVCHVPESRYNLISLGALHREGFYFSSKGDLMKVFKGPYDVSSRTCRQCAYEVTVSGLQLSSSLKVVVVKQLETTMDSSSHGHLYLEGRLRLRAQQGSPDRYSYG